MSNNNIDSLQINISAATSGAIANLEGLIKKLGALGDALESGSNTAVFTNNINDLTSSLSSLKQIVSGLDVNSVKSMASAVGSLAKNLGTLSGVGKSISNVSKTSTVQKGISEAAKARIAQLKEEKELLLAEKADRQRVSTGWTSKTNAEVGDNWRSIKGYTGNIGKKTKDENIEMYDNYLRATGSQLPDNVEDAIKQSGEGIMDIVGKIRMLDDEIDKLERGVIDVKAAIANSPLDDNAIANYADGLDDDWLPGMDSKPAQEVVQVAQELSTTGESASNNIKLIAEGLSSLEGVRIDAEQFAGLSKLASATTSLNAVSGETVANSLSGIGRGLTELSTAQLPNTENLVIVVDAISKFGRGSIQNAGASVLSIANGLRELTPVAEGLGSVDTEKITAMAMAMAKFGTAGAGRAATNLPQIAQGFVQLAQALSTAPEVSDKTLRLAEAMAQVSRRSLEAKTNTSGLASNFKVLGNSTHKVGLNFTSLAAKLGYLYANFFLVIRAARLAGKAIEYSSQMTEALNVVDVAFGKANNTMKDFMETSIENFGLGRLAAAQYASRFQAMGKTLGISAEEVGKANDFIAKKTAGNARAYDDLGNSVADMSINLTKLTADMASLYNQDYDDVAKDMQSVYTGMTRPLRRYGLDLTQATLKEWALANGLQADVENMTQAEKTLLRYQYVMSNASVAMGDFQKTADTWANAMRTVKQLLQEFARLLGEGFINAFRPALLAFRNFMYTMLDLTQKALNAVGKLLGWEKIDFGGAALAEDMEDFADATDDANDAAKRLKGQLRGIDELNNLTTSDKGKGGGGVSSGIGYDGKDLWEQIKETKEKYISDVDSWKELGQRIADKIFEGLSDIDWDSRTEGARNFGTNLAGFLNGLIDPKTFKEVGKTIAKSIMLGINFVDAFADEFEFEELGEAIGEGINGFFENFDGYKAAETIGKIADGLDTAFTRAAGTINWREVFKDLFQFFSKLTVDNLDLVVKYLAIAAGVKFTVGFATGVLEEIGRQFATKLATEMGIKLTSLSIAEIGTGFGVKFIQGASQKLATEVGSKVTTELATQGVKAEISNVDIAPAAGGVNVLGASTVGGYIGAAIVTAILGYMAGNWIQDQVGKFLGSDTWLFDKVPKVGYSPYDQQPKAGSYVKYPTGKEAIEMRAKSKGITFEDNVFGGQIPIVKRSNTSRPITQQIYDTKAAAAFNKVVSSTKNLTKTTNGAVTEWEKLNGVTVEGVKVSTNASTAYSNAGRQAASSASSASSASTSSSSTINKNLNSVKSTSDKTFNYSTWNNYGKNMTSTLGKGIDSVKDSWNSLVKSIGAGLNINVKTTTTGGGTTATSQTIYIPTTYVPGAENGELKQKTWHNLPAKPSYLPTSSYASWLEEWKRNHPENYYAEGGFPQIASLFWAGENGVPELLGTVGGKTAVAGGSEITGIRDAIMQTASEEIGVLRQQNTLLQGILDKEFGISSDTLFRSIRNSANNFTTRTGRPAF